MDMSMLPKLDPASGRSATAQIAAAIRAAVRDKRFRPGQRVPGQVELAAHFGVSRETVRRALETLRDVLDGRQGEGTFVRVVPGAYYGVVLQYPDGLLEEDGAMFFDTVQDAVKHVDAEPDNGSLRIFHMQEVSSVELHYVRRDLARDS